VARPYRVLRTPEGQARHREGSRENIQELPEEVDVDRQHHHGKAVMGGILSPVTEERPSQLNTPSSVMEAGSIGTPSSAFKTRLHGDLAAAGSMTPFSLEEASNKELMTDPLADYEAYERRMGMAEASNPAWLTLAKDDPELAKISQEDAEVGKILNQEEARPPSVSPAAIKSNLINANGILLERAKTPPKARRPKGTSKPPGEKAKINLGGAKAVMASYTALRKADRRSKAAGELPTTPYEVQRKYEKETKAEKWAR